MAATPNDVQQLLRQLEPVLTRWHEQDKLGEVAIKFGENLLQVEERPVRVTVKVRRHIAVRAKAIEVVG